MMICKDEFDEIMKKIAKGERLNEDDCFTLCALGYNVPDCDCFICPYNGECDCGQDFLDH